MEIILKETFYEVKEEYIKTNTELKSNLTQIENKIEKLEEKFIEDIIENEVYQKHKEKYINKKAQILEELEKPELQISNLDLAIKYGVEISSNLLNIWKSNDYDKRIALLKMMFPDRLRYNRKEQQFRTSRVNALFSLNQSISNDYTPIKSKRQINKIDLSHYVDLSGLSSNFIIEDLLIIKRLMSDRK